VLQREFASLESARSANTRGQALISPTRLDQGTRFIGAACLRNADRIAVLDVDGQLTLYEAGVVAGAGALPTAKTVLSLGVIPSGEGRRSRP